MITVKALMLGLALSTLSLAPQAAHVGEAEMSEILPASGQAREGKPAPWLAGWTLDDQVFNLNRPFRDNRVQRLVLVFWATWCLPCRDGLQSLETAFADLENAGTAVALINFGETAETATRFTTQHFHEGVAPFPVVLDPYQNCLETYLARADGQAPLPLTVVIDRQGLVLRIIGAKGDDYVALLLADLVTD